MFMRQMMRSLIFAAFAPLLVSACDDATGPATRFAVHIADIVVPAAAAATDTIPIRFTYEASCGEREVVLAFSPDRLEVRAFGILPSREIVCPAWMFYAERTVLIPPTQRSLPYTVVFVQPWGGDSIRVIQPAVALKVAP